MYIYRMFVNKISKQKYCLYEHIEGSGQRAE
jgi:hypothetical protein